jgi:hypothetical protein
LTDEQPDSAQAIRTALINKNPDRKKDRPLATNNWRIKTPLNNGAGTASIG